MSMFQGKRAFITGGSSGIGFALARQLVEQGAGVAIAARRPEPLESARAELAELAGEGQSVESFVLDVSDSAAVSAVASDVIQALGGVDLVVNNAGVAHPGYATELSEDVYRSMIEVNYLGTVWVTRAFLPTLVEQGSGRIVNVSSIAGVVGAFGYSAYGGSKFAVSGYSECLRQELKPLGVGVSLLCPPDTDTPQLAYENQFKPAETKALSGNVKPMSAEAVADAMLKGVAAGRYLIVPGLDGWFTVFMAQRFPGLVRWVMDGMIRKAQE